MTLHVALFDDHVALRAALAVALQREHDLLVVAQASETEAALTLLQSTQPDVAVVDIAMPGRDGFHLIREAKRLGIPTRMLVLTMFGRNTNAQDAFAAGASGFALKTQPLEDIADAIRTVGGGMRYVAPGVVSLPASPPGNPRGGMNGLSKREKEILRLIVDGKQTKEIAKDLAISQKTVETHRCSINRKLDVHSVGELMRFAAGAGQMI